MGPHKMLSYYLQLHDHKISDFQLSLEHNLLFFPLKEKFQGKKPYSGILVMFYGSGNELFSVGTDRKC